MWRGKEAKKYVTWRRSFQQCENSVPLLIASSMLLRSRNIISDGWLRLDAQVIEIWRSNHGPKVDDENVILTKFLIWYKIHPGSIWNHYLGWELIRECEFELKIVQGATQNRKLFKAWPRTTNIWERRPGAHERIFPDHYFEYVETSGWDTALWS